MKANIIAVVNQKGGVGKTTTVANLGTALSSLNKKVLVVDIDPQGHSGIHFGYAPHTPANTLTTIMQNMIWGVPVEDHPIVHNEAENIDLILSNRHLAGIENSLSTVLEGRETMLKRYLETLTSTYDYILLDCALSLGNLTVNVMVAADSVIIPSQPQFLSAMGLQQILLTIRQLNQNFNPSLCVKGVLATAVDMRTKSAKEFRNIVHDSFGGAIPVFDTIIPRYRSFELAPHSGGSIHRFHPDSTASAAYVQLGNEVAQI